MARWGRVWQGPSAGLFVAAYVLRVLAWLVQASADSAAAATVSMGRGGWLCCALAEMPTLRQS